jgi:hypothetical protein
MSVAFWGWHNYFLFSVAYLLLFFFLLYLHSNIDAAVNLPCSANLSKANKF